MKFVSLIVLATGLFTAVGASVVARRASPDPDAAIATVIIQPLLNSTLCITASGTTVSSATILSPCSNFLSQLWSVNAITANGPNTVQFQNVGNNQCFAEITTPVTDGLVVTSEPCLQTNGVSFSGVLFDASQTITKSKLPLVVTALNSRADGTAALTGFCLDHAGNTVVLNQCTGSLPQSWLITSPL
ncbi:hypothetical protein C8F04DRAFT_302735 [Mycena alexandri]|uniref:Ricin B lectin domain-containing protein n=1 Tax=Mycena alexandri TaxID=1745969 RepID=A0AAD6WTF9_9AGAR|nr:hypothetical protein C8F04DRAFT_302735 [Mycena alexandri]